MGKGELKLLDTVSYLDEFGYKGPLSIEIEFTEAYTMRAKAEGDLAFANQAVKDSYEYLAQKGLV